MELHSFCLCLFSDRRQIQFREVPVEDRRGSISFHVHTNGKKGWTECAGKCLTRDFPGYVTFPDVPGKLPSSCQLQSTSASGVRRGVRNQPSGPA